MSDDFDDDKKGDLVDDINDDNDDDDDAEKNACGGSPGVTSNYLCLPLLPLDKG